MGLSVYRFFLFFVVLASFNICTYSQHKWERLENLNGGNVRSLLITDNKNVLAGTENGGMYKFNFSANLWESINDSLGYNIIWLIANDFKNNIYITSWSGNGLLRSTDEGITWTVTAVTRSIHCFKKDTVNKRILAGSEGFIYESSDNGLTWIEDSVANVSIYSVDVDDEGTMYAATSDGLFKRANTEPAWTKINTSFGFTYFHYVKVHNNEIYLPVRQILYKSADGGNSWSTIFSLNTYSAYMESILFDNENTIFIAYDTDGIYKSTDGGQNFVGVNFSIPQLNFLEYDAERNCLFAGSRDGILFSFNNGKDWNKYNEGLFNLRITELCTGKFDYIFAASHYNDSYVKVSEDYGKTWKGTNLHSQWNTNMISDAYGNVFIIQDNVIYKYDFGRKNFEYFKTVPYFSSISSDRFGSVFICYNDYAGKIVWLKKDGTETEIPSVSGKYVNFIAEDSRGDFYAVRTDNGTTSFYKFDFENSTWTEQSSIQVAHVNDFALDSHDNFYLAGASYYGLYKSTNGGKNWSQIADRAEDITIDSLDQIYVASYYNVKKSTDGGVHWNLLTYLYDGHFISLTKTMRGNLFAGNDYDGLYRYLDEASYPVKIKDFIYTLQDRLVTIQWATEDDRRNTGFSLERSSDSTLWEERGFIPGNASDTALSKMYVMGDLLKTPGSFYYRLKQISTDSLISYSDILTVDYTFIESDFSFRLDQNYPNPFNNSAVIRFAVPEKLYVTLKIYDILGNEVQILLNEEKPPGIYEIKFNADRLASGVYFYQIRAGAFIKTKKMILLR